MCLSPFSTPDWRRVYCDRVCASLAAWWRQNIGPIYGPKRSIPPPSPVAQTYPQHYRAAFSLYIDGQQDQGIYPALELKNITSFRDVRSIPTVTVYMWLKHNGRLKKKAG